MRRLSKEKTFRGRMPHGDRSVYRIDSESFVGGLRAADCAGAFRLYAVRWDREGRAEDEMGRLIYSMGVSIDGFTADREGDFSWAPPGEEQFAFHTALVSELGGVIMGRRLYEAMLPWETDASMRTSRPMEAFADIWTAIPKVVFSRTLDRVEGNARLAEASLAEEVASMIAGTDGDVEIGGPGLARQAVEAGLIDEYRMFRCPVVVGGGTPYWPVVAETIRLDFVETRTFSGGVVYERYVRRAAASVESG
jgi:dihydrofolate reductase